MRHLDSNRARAVWIRRKNTLVDVIALLGSKPNRATWSGAEWRTYNYARAISRRLSSTN